MVHKSRRDAFPSFVGVMIAGDALTSSVDAHSSAKYVLTVVDPLTEISHRSWPGDAIRGICRVQNVRVPARTFPLLALGERHRSACRFVRAKQSLASDTHRFVGSRRVILFTDTGDLSSAECVLDAIAIPHAFLSVLRCPVLLRDLFPSENRSERRQ